jgi:alpha-D-ribose 1-methylphosphonate 5-triphosphate synthase subunit PhnH
VTDLWVDSIPETFWALREQTCRYPLGWDVLLVSNDRVAGLPRTTRIEVE